MPNGMAMAILLSIVPKKECIVKALLYVVDICMTHNSCFTLSLRLRIVKNVIFCISDMRSVQAHFTIEKKLVMVFVEKVLLTQVGNLFPTHP